jgi:hypothetical protein
MDDTAVSRSDEFICKGFQFFSLIEYGSLTGYGRAVLCAMGRAPDKLRMTTIFTHEDASDEAPQRNKRSNLVNATATLHNAVAQLATVAEADGIGVLYITKSRGKEIISVHATGMFTNDVEVPSGYSSKALTLKRLLSGDAALECWTPFEFYHCLPLRLKQGLPTMEQIGKSSEEIAKPKRRVTSYNVRVFF